MTGNWDNNGNVIFLGMDRENGAGVLGRIGKVTGMGRVFGGGAICRGGMALMACQGSVCGINLAIATIGPGRCCS